MSFPERESFKNQFRVLENARRKQKKSGKEEARDKRAQNTKNTKMFTTTSASSSASSAMMRYQSGNSASSSGKSFARFSSTISTTAKKKDTTTERLSSSPLRRRTTTTTKGRRSSSSAFAASEVSNSGDFEAALDPVYKNTLYDVPVSNNGARNRLIICWKNIEDEFEFKNPSTLGGLKSPEFLEMHPQGKMPLLVTKDGQAIPESEVISQYLCDAFGDKGPSLRPETLEAKTACNLATRWHDVYLTPIQGCMYRGPMAPEVRAEQISEIDRLLDVLEKTVCGFEPGPYLCGDKPSTADAALFPTFVFMTHLLPKYFGWENVFDGRPSLERWYKYMSTEDECAKKIKMEVMGGLMAWDESDRYEKNGLVAAVANDSFQWSY